MKKITSTLVTTIALIGSAWAFASEEAVITIGGVEMENSSSSDAFEAVKKKLGRWEGQMTQSLTGETFDVSYEWAVTSGGNTITETITEDGVEMLTTYSEQDGQLKVTHYCSLGTEPEFTASISGGSVDLTLAADTGLHAEHHNYVASMNYNFSDVESGSVVVSSTIMNGGAIESNRAVISRVE